MLTLPPRPTTTLTLPRGGDPDRFLRSLVTTSSDAWAMSHSSVHITDAIAHALRVYGTGAEVHMAFFWLSERHSEDIIGMVRSGRIGRIRLYLNQEMLERGDAWDNSHTSMRVEAGKGATAGRLLRQYLPPDAVSWIQIHAKAIALRWTDGRCLSIVTSQADPSIHAEWWHATTSPEAHAWLVASLESGKPDRLPVDLELAFRLKRTPYVRPFRQQDVRKHLADSAVRFNLAEGTTYLTGGPALPSISLLAAIAVRMPRPPAVHLAGWWFSQRGIRALKHLEDAGIILPPSYLADVVLTEGIYGDGAATNAFNELIPPDRRRGADVHAKLALLEPEGAPAVLMTSTGNWQPTNPRIEFYCVTTSPEACQLARVWLKGR